MKGVCKLFWRTVEAAAGSPTVLASTVGPAEDADSAQQESPPGATAIPIATASPIAKKMITHNADFASRPDLRGLWVALERWRRQRGANSHKIPWERGQEGGAGSALR